MEKNHRSFCIFHFFFFVSYSLLCFFFILFQAEHCVSAISQILHLNPLHFWKIHTAVFIR